MALLKLIAELASSVTVIASSISKIIEYSNNIKENQYQRSKKYRMWNC